jgi:N-acetyl-gamma-glutamylphosphate reductase
MEIFVSVVWKSNNDLTETRTGATGYIGGDILYELTARHPELSYTALIRDQDKAKRINAQYPSVRCVIGVLDNSLLLATESANADIVIRK